MAEHGPGRGRADGRHVCAYHKPDQGGGRELLGAPAPAPERAAAIDVPAVVLSAQEWAAKTRVTDAPED